MKNRCSTTVISALLLSLCIVTFIPAGLSNALTWKELYFEWPGLNIQNFLMPIGFAYLGIAMIGLIILWTGYRKGERWAWFVMLIILLCFVIPSSVMPVLLQIRAQNYRWSLLLDLLSPFRDKECWHCLTILPSRSKAVGIECMAVAMLIGLFTFLVMLIALLLPVKVFFWGQSAAQVKAESPHVRV